MPNPGPADPPELADVGRLARRLLRKAALLACEDDDSEGPIRVTDAHLDAALDQLLDTRNQLTRVLLGGEHPRQAGAVS
jgi:hypothetical protein